MNSILQKFALGILAVGLTSLGISKLAAQETSVPEQLSTSSSMVVREIREVDPSESVEITVVNNLSGSLGIGFSGGPKVTLISGDEEIVSFPPESAPFNLFIYPLDFEASIRYDVSLTENSITLEAVTVNDVAPGDRSINVDLEGNVYVF
jgi:hypothetical protein